MNRASGRGIVAPLTYLVPALLWPAMTIAQPQFAVDEAEVPAATEQPGGPPYTYFMERYPTTNEAFVAFLNDALNHPTSERGHYLYLDESTGRVFVNNVAAGDRGTGAGVRTLLMFDPAAAGQIVFENNSFRVATEPFDFRRHPVAGVSWYGALKYCNWLTLDQGLPVEARCYREAGSGTPGAWHPESISTADWATRDMTDAERGALIADCRGFRLPMDDGYNNFDPTTDAADDYNEWYKAAAWNEAQGRNTLYGFGRDLLGGADANFRCSGDPFEDAADCLLGGTTPVGFYDGSVQNVGGVLFATNASANGFGIHDLTGNVHEWLQGRFAPPTSVNRRVLRGGSWHDSVSAFGLRNNRRPYFASPGTTDRQIGFRVVRAAAPTLALCLTGPATPRWPFCVNFDADGNSRVDLRDVAAFQRDFGSSP